MTLVPKVIILVTLQPCFKFTFELNSLLGGECAVTQSPFVRKGALNRTLNAQVKMLHWSIFSIHWASLWKLCCFIKFLFIRVEKATL
jgi:hypothetical protein